MGHYDDCYEHEEEKREEAYKKQKQAVVQDINSAIKKLEKLGEDGFCRQVVYQKLKEAQMWAEEL